MIQDEIVLSDIKKDDKYTFTINVSNDNELGYSLLSIYFKTHYRHSEVQYIPYCTISQYLEGNFMILYSKIRNNTAIFRKLC